jgi:NAD(P)-dependent dehydrogenase (short-subunit alcohol dehydrogenase family)
MQISIENHYHSASQTRSLQIDAAAYGPFTDTSFSDYDKVHSVNAKAQLVVGAAVVKVMQAQQSKSVTTLRGSVRDIGKGAIVNVASALSYGAVPGKIGYIASKHALLGITKAMGTCTPRSDDRD